MQFLWTILRQQLLHKRRDHKARRGRYHRNADLSTKQLTVIDFKTATRKRDERNENYLVQASFYSIAWEERTGEKINQIAILTTTEDGELDVYKDNPSNYVGRLEEMIEEYKTGKIGDQ